MPASTSPEPAVASQSGPSGTVRAGPSGATSTQVAPLSSTVAPVSSAAGAGVVQRPGLDLGPLDRRHASDARTSSRASSPACGVSSIGGPWSGRRGVRQEGRARRHRRRTGRPWPERVLGRCAAARRRRPGRGPARRPRPAPARRQAPPRASATRTRSVGGGGPTYRTMPAARRAPPRRCTARPPRCTSSRRPRRPAPRASTCRPAARAPARRGCRVRGAPTARPPGSRPRRCGPRPMSTTRTAPAARSAGGSSRHGLATPKVTVTSAQTCAQRRLARCPGRPRSAGRRPRPPPRPVRRRPAGPASSPRPGRPPMPSNPSTTTSARARAARVVVPSPRWTRPPAAVRPARPCSCAVAAGQHRVDPRPRRAQAGRRPTGRRRRCCPGRPAGRPARRRPPRRAARRRRRPERSAARCISWPSGSAAIARRSAVRTSSTAYAAIIGQPSAMTTAEAMPASCEMRQVQGGDAERLDPRLDGALDVQVRAAALVAPHPGVGPAQAGAGRRATWRAPPWRRSSRPAS